MNNKWQLEKSDKLLINDTITTFLTMTTICLRCIRPWQLRRTKAHAHHSAPNSRLRYTKKCAPRSSLILTHVEIKKINITVTEWLNRQTTGKLALVKPCQSAECDQCIAARTALSLSMPHIQILGVVPEVCFARDFGVQNGADWDRSIV